MKSFDINNIQFTLQSPDSPVDTETEAYIINQVEKLGKLMPAITRCETLLSQEKDSHHKNSMVEVKLFVTGSILFSKEQENNYRHAAQKAFDDVRDQLIKLKDKRDDKTVDLSGLG